MRLRIKTFLIILAVPVVGIVAFIAWAIWRTDAGGRDAYLELAARIAPVEERLTANQDPDPADLECFAQDRATRKVLYDALEHHGRLGLFPAKYLTPEAMAEADLVRWLVHPNELQAPPDEIELMATVPAPGEAFRDQRYFVFRYKTNPPHWGGEGRLACGHRRALSGCRFRLTERRRHIQPLRGVRIQNARRARQSHA